MILIEDFIKGFSNVFSEQKNLQPWDITQNLNAILRDLISQLDNSYKIRDDIAIHKTSNIEKSAILKAPIVICEHCFVGANSYLRNGTYLGESTIVGTGCEIKASIIFAYSAIAHFNFIGDSIIGNRVNFEAGSVTANHFNEKDAKKISVVFNSNIIDTNIEKFGALVGDNSKIGANAVLSPGTILKPHSIVKRLELIDQQKG